MKTYYKLVDEVVTIPFAYDNFTELAENGDTLVSGEVDILSGDDALATTDNPQSVSTDGQSILCTFSAGTVGVSYLVECEATFGSGAVRGVQGLVWVVDKLS
jgi:hypothetical protein